MKKLTVGMAVYGDMDGVFFTVQSLRMYHDMRDCEILVVDNKGSKNLENWIRAWGSGVVRYEKYTEVQGTAAPRQKVFELAEGEYVICLDSHVVLVPGAIDRLWEGDCLIHGPMLYDSLGTCVTGMKDVWRDNMWGIWDDPVKTDLLPADQFEIWGHGLGLFGCRKDSWLGFNSEFRQFGGEEGYIHEKYRKAGKKIICLPWMRWNHRFEEIRDVKSTFEKSMVARVKNYLIGFKELGMDITPIVDHFGVQMVNKAREKNE